MIAKVDSNIDNMVDNIDNMIAKVDSNIDNMVDNIDNTIATLITWLITLIT
jgi:DNA anti-recombination protein RmuC